MADAVSPRAEELALADAWWDAHFAGDAANLPFSFWLDGKPLAGLPAGWAVERRQRELDDRRDEMVLTARHPDHGLEVRCVAIRYRDFPAVEWTLHLRQTDAGVCPLVSEVLGVDAEWRPEPGNSFVIRSHKGDTGQSDLYEPWSKILASGRGITIAPTWGSGLVSTGETISVAAAAFEKPEGRPSSGAFPFFAVEETGAGPCAARPMRRGLLVAVGWPGRWRAEFACDQAATLRIRAGQEHTRFRLRPGETARAPLIALLFSIGGDRVRAQNLWRRWMLAHNLPRIAGALPRAMLEASTCGFLEEMTRADEANQIEYIDRYREAKLPITHWWMDAGWYPCYVPAKGKNCWGQTGTWEPDRKRFPAGLRAVADHLHANGIRTIVWFEPERVAPATWLHDQRPGWLLVRLDQTAAPAGMLPASWDDLWRCARLLDLGNAEALAWLIERTCSLIDSEGIDVYRQDFNTDPLLYWRDNDPPGREGLTENHHVTGYLAFWDALRRRYPDMLIDSCASGGRRNDLETLRRSVALHPTDYNYADLPVKQCLRHSLFGWMPYFGGPVLPLDRVDAVAFRSTMGLSTVVGFDLRQEHDLVLLRKLMAEWHAVAECYYGDYYPLTSYSRADDAWMAWQFHRPEQGDGVVQVFRRAESPHESAAFPLSALDPGATYEVRDFDEPAPTRHSGAELLVRLKLTLSDRPSARTLHYRPCSGRPT
jgi:alpha-galactosidase